MPDMIERLEQRILHKKATCWPDAGSSPICIHPASELSKHKIHGLKYNHSSRALETRGAIPLLGALIRVKGNVKRIYLDFKEMCRKRAAVGSPSTPAPSPPASLRECRKTGEGAGLLVRLATHLREVISLKIQKQNNNKLAGSPLGPLVLSAWTSISRDGFDNLLSVRDVGRGS
jgi:hypothetical protein